jgi:hypothetical protein
VDCNRLSPKCKSQLKELNIFKEGELSKKSVVAIFATTATDDKTYQVDHLHLEMIMGYRVKPPQGTQFRIWATKQFKEYISKGFVLDNFISSSLCTSLSLLFNLSCKKKT